MFGTEPPESLRSAAASRPAPVLKAHGAFRSGSNYAKAILELNYDVEVRNGDGGFKHAPYPALFDGRSWVPPSHPVLVTVKEPHAWLASMWRYSQARGKQHIECGPTWDRFLIEPVSVFHGGFPGFPRLRYPSPIEYWNALYYNLLSLDPDVRCVVRYRGMLTNPEAEAGRVATQFALRRTTPTFTHVQQRVRNMADRRRRTLDDYVDPATFDGSYYLERRYLEEFTAEQLGWVDEHLAEDVSVALGYHPSPGH